MTLPRPVPTRRRFLAAATATAAASTVAMPAIAQSAPTIRWRLTSGYPKALDTIYGGAETVAKYVREMTDGRFEIQPFAAGEIVGGLHRSTPSRTARSRWRTPTPTTMSARTPPSARPPRSPS